MPSGKVDKPTVDDNRDGTVSIRYDPREEGLHEMTLKYNGEHVQGNLKIDSEKCGKFKIFISIQVHLSSSMSTASRRDM